MACPTRRLRILLSAAAPALSLLSESTPNHGFLGAWRLGPGCPLPRAGALLSALRVVQEWPVRASLSGLPKGEVCSQPGEGPMAPDTALPCCTQPQPHAGLYVLVAHGVSLP